MPTSSMPASERATEGKKASKGAAPKLKSAETTHTVATAVTSCAPSGHAMSSPSAAVAEAAAAGAEGEGGAGGEAADEAVDERGGSTADGVSRTSNATSAPASAE